MGTISTVLRYAPKFIGFALRRFTFKQEKKKLDVKEARLRAFKIVHQHTHDILKATKTKVVTSGLENIPKDVPVLFVGNHQSIFDVVAHMSQMEKPTIFIAKKELRALPVFGKWMEEMGCLFLDREKPLKLLMKLHAVCGKKKSTVRFILKGPDPAQAKLMNSKEEVSN